MRSIGHWINGRVVEGSGRAADVFNPATGEVQARVALASREEVGRAIAAAARAQEGWGATNPQKRARVMMEMVRLLNRDMDALAEALSSEHGKTLPDARGDVQRGLALADRLEAGIVHVNDQSVNDEPQMPFGGVKDSGWGRFGIGFSAEEFSDLNWVTSRTQSRSFPF